MSRTVNFGAAVARFAGDQAVVHVRFAGRSRDIPLTSLGIDRVSRDQEIKRAVAVHLEVPADDFNDSIVDRHANGNLTIRPEAVFG